jgi:hypothetical protein
LKAAWPQQVCLVLYETVQPAFSNTRTMLNAVSGNS